MEHWLEIRHFGRRDPEWGIADLVREFTLFRRNKR
jgi:hypothetical protein